MKTKIETLLYSIILTGYVSLLWQLFVTKQQQSDENRDSVRESGSFIQSLRNLVYKDEAAQVKFRQSLIPDAELGTLSQRGLNKPLILMYTHYYDHVWWSGLNDCNGSCILTTDKSQFDKADMVMFQGWKRCEFNSASPHGVRCYGWDIPDEEWEWPGRKIKGQVWLFSQFESQQNSANGVHIQFIDNLFNYTRTYKVESTVHHPYGKTGNTPRPGDEYAFLAKHKSKLLLWFVSHCNVPVRDRYAAELSRHVQLDQFGSCNGVKDECGKGDYECTNRMKKKYKFYLAFENSICNEYITEKFWMSLFEGMVPVVLGSSVSDYLKVAPPDSFLHIDNFTSPSQLAEYINYLDKHDDIYDRYQKWRTKYSIQPAWTLQGSSCSLCSLARNKPASTVKLSQWWNMDKECRNITKAVRKAYDKIPVLTVT